MSALPMQGLKVVAHALTLYREVRPASAGAEVSDKTRRESAGCFWSVVSPGRPTMGIRGGSIQQNVLCRRNCLCTLEDLAVDLFKCLFKFSIVLQKMGKYDPTFQS